MSYYFDAIHVFLELFAKSTKKNLKKYKEEFEKVLENIY